MLINAINLQIQMELHAELLYWQMSIWCKEHNYPGFAHFFMLQSQEERTHAERLVKHMLDRGWKVEIVTLEKNHNSVWSGVPSLMQDLLMQEKKNTESIHGLHKRAVEVEDLALQRELDWFVTEQVEEEALAQEWLERTARADTATGLMMLDAEAGARLPEE